MRSLFSAAEISRNVPSRSEREAVAKAFIDLAQELRMQLSVAEIEADYLALQTGNNQFKNAISIVPEGVAFYTRDSSLNRLFSEHGLPVTEAPLKNELSVHNEHRWKIPHIASHTVKEFRPLFLAMVRDSVAYVQSQTQL